MKDASYWKVKTLPQDLVDHLVQQIYHADPFKEEMMTEWETRPAVNKTWERCTQYFLQAADKLRIHQKATAKQSGYHSAANVQEEAEKAEKVAQEEAE